MNVMRALDLHVHSPVINTNLLHSHQQYALAGVYRIARKGSSQSGILGSHLKQQMSLVSSWGKD
jgi:hypothetical protein